MNWFTQLCRNTGLMIHNVIHPEDTKTHEVNKTVEEKQVSEKVTLRRTTIEEIEIKKDT